MKCIFVYIYIYIHVNCTFNCVVVRFSPSEVALATPQLHNIVRARACAVRARAGGARAAV